MPISNCWVWFKIVGAEIVGTKNGNELGIKKKRGIGTKVGGDFLRLVLKNQGTRGFERVIMRKRQVNRLIERDQRWGLRLNGGYKQQQQCGRRQNADPEVPWAHRGQAKMQPPWGELERSGD